jgi:hypothetical protein
MTCDACGQSYGIGQWFACPHPFVNARAAAEAAQVTWPGGRTFENLGDQPKTFYSPSEYRAYLRSHNIEEFVRHVPEPGSDKSRHTTSWAGMDAQTLANAAALVGGARRETPEPTYIASMTVTVTEEQGTVRAAKGTFGVFEDAVRSQR